MRRPSPAVLAALLAATAAVLGLTAGGCAWTQDERDFYGRGWVNPRELDRPAPYRGLRPIAGESPADGTPASPTAPGVDSSINRQ